jgi:hypothetical protein
MRARSTAPGFTQSTSSFDDLMAASYQAANQFEADQARMSSAAEKAAGKIAQPYTKAFDQIGASWTRAAAGLINGTLTWQQAAIKAGEGVTNGLTSMAETVLSKSAAGPLASLLGLAAPKPGEGVGAVLGGGLSGLLTKGLGLPSAVEAGEQTANTTAIAANTVALTTLAATLAAGSAAAGGTALATGAGAAADLGGAATGGGIFSWLGGLLAFGRGGIVPSAARGWALPSFAGARPALLHGSEMVLPANISEGLQGMIAQGGAGADMHLHFHGPSDGPAVERWFTGLMTRNPGVVRNMLRSNALTPRSI